ncbi:MAG: extracellular solute-binding protein [Spirochaetaceae bacterium]|jgi:raffinose/stachyose/melibiose transport system substrate-binding protein|nr:extracellular solute-binding protein [Spirochaetaceae bacterium]
MMKNKSRFLMWSGPFLVFAAALFVFPLYAPPLYGGGQQTGREQITMWFWGAAPEYRMVLEEALVKPYNASQDTYELVVSYDNAVDNNIATALAADGGNAPDIVYGSGPAFVSQYAQAGKLLDLTPYAARYGWIERIMPAIYEAGKVNGKLYCLPGGTVTMGVFYNKKVLNDLRAKDPSLPRGVPATIAEFERFMEAALKNGYYASVTGNKGWKPVNENYSTIFLNAVAGPENVYKAVNGQKAFTDAEFVKAVNKSAEWYQKGYLGGGHILNETLVIDYPNLNFAESCQLLADDKAAFFVGPSLAFQFMNTYFQGNKTENLGFTVFPMDPSIPTQSYVLGVVNSFSIWSGSKHADEAAKIMDMMMSSAFAQSLARVWPGYWAVPLNEFNPDTSGFSSLSLEFVSTIQKMYRSVASGNFGIHISTFYPPLTQAALIDIERVWLKDQTAEEFLRNVAAEYQKDAARGSIPGIPAPNGAR